MICRLDCAMFPSPPCDGAGTIQYQLSGATQFLKVSCVVDFAGRRRKLQCHGNSVTAADVTRTKQLPKRPDNPDAESSLP